MSVSESHRGQQTLATFSAVRNLTSFSETAISFLASAESACVTALSGSAAEHGKLLFAVGKDRAVVQGYSGCSPNPWEVFFILFILFLFLCFSFIPW